MTHRRKRLYGFGLSWCYLCKSELPLSEFYKDRRQSHGYSPKCKSCQYVLGLLVKVNLDKHKKRQRRYREKNAERCKAYRAVAKAIRNKTIIKPETCVRCNLRGDIEAHHNDYSKPLKIKWLCTSCHSLTRIKR